MTPENQSIWDEALWNVDAIITVLWFTPTKAESLTRVYFFFSPHNNGSDADISLSEKDKQLKEKEAEVCRSELQQQGYLAEDETPTFKRCSTGC